MDRTRLSKALQQYRKYNKNYSLPVVELASAPGYLWPKTFADDEYSCFFGFGVLDAKIGGGLAARL